MGKIIQIIPADGWYAEYQGKDKNINDGIFRMKLVCFALLDDGRIVGFDACDAPDNILSPSEDSGNFIGYKYYK